jgi:hypothetical protein
MAVSTGSKPNSGLSRNYYESYADQHLEGTIEVVEGTNRYGRLRKFCRNYFSAVNTEQ